MRTSKYLNKKFDNNWVCTYIGIANMCNKRYKFKSGKTKRPGHRSYYYIFERPTSDNKADKIIRLTAAQAAKVYRGELLVEDLANKKLDTRSDKYTEKVSYSFYQEDN